MSDSGITPPTDPASTKKSPLDVLDQILNDAQTKAAQSAAKQSEEDTKALAAEKERQKQEDAARIAAELQALEEAKHSPQYIATQEQKHEEAQVQQQKKAELQGMEIRQLGHTKI